MNKVFEFLNLIKDNNNREWFQENKDTYDEVYERMNLIANQILYEMNQHDLIETATGKKSLYRIYRDVRFSKDKTPYKSNWSGGFKRATAQKRGGYYYHIEPGGSYLAGGFWGPNKDDLKLIREHLAQDSSEYRKIINSKDFKLTFDIVLGEKLKKCPKGFDIEHPDIDLLRHKQFVLKYNLTDKVVLSDSFPRITSEIFKKMRPYFNLMSEYLTTDSNGIEIYA
jgi:uncharacterized protein (TIGR02453 family)